MTYSDRSGYNRLSLHCWSAFLIASFAEVALHKEAGFVVQQGVGDTAV